MNKSLYNRELDLLAQASNFFTDTWDKITTFFTSYQWQEILFNIKFAFIIISLILLALIIFLLIKISIISPLHKNLFRPSRSNTPVFSKKKIIKRWGKIEKRLSSGIEANYKLAIIEADRLFDMVLKNIGYGTENKLTNIEEIKKAGKLKDSIIEDKKFKLSKEETKNAIESYKKGLEELGVL